MAAIYWLMYANMVLWLGLGSYMAFLFRVHANNRRRLDALETPHV